MNTVKIPIINKLNIVCVKISFSDMSGFFTFVGKDLNKGSTFISTISYDKNFKHQSSHIVDNLFFFNKTHHDNMTLEYLKN